MEDDETKRKSLSKSSSISPKVSRPKLPSFAGLGSRSINPRSKTDPGRGEIKAIMEDIMNLKQTNWKTFSRSRPSTLPKGKSVSTNSSPNTSPRIGSPVGHEDQRFGLSRDRSRSLKVLTDRLLHKNSKQTVPEVSKSSDENERKDAIVSRTTDRQSSGNKSEHWTSQFVPGPGQPPGSHQGGSPDRRAVEQTCDLILESPEDAEQDDAEATKSASSDESFRTVPEYMHDDFHVAHEKSPDIDCRGRIREKSYDSDGGGSIRSQEEYMKLASPTEKITEDEGMIEGGEHAPIVSTYTYHPIHRNSPFLRLAATKPPKRFPNERRSGLAMLAPRGRIGAVSKHVDDESRSSEGHSADDKPRQRFQRRSDSGKSSTQKSSPRFITHPPHTKVLHEEAGSVDSNGFAALKSTPESDEDQKHSHVSLTDSQFASGETSDESIYQDVMESIATDVSDRKNGKASKQKSKSDPSGDRARETLDFPQVLENPQSQSAPLLSKDELEALGLEKSLSDGEKQRFRSENTLASSSYNVCEEAGDGHSSAGEDDDAGSIDFKTSSRSTPDSEHVLSPASRFPSSPVISAPVTSHGPSPSPVPMVERPSNLLNVPPSSGRKSNIFRSASSASVFQSRKPIGSPLRDKDVIRKYSITSDEAMINSKSSANLVPEFLPIGDTVNASSMPAVWNKDRLSSSAESPEREPGFIKVRTTNVGRVVQDVIFSILFFFILDQRGPKRHTACDVVCATSACNCQREFLTN